MDNDANVTKRIKHLFSKKGSPIKSEWNFYIKNYGIIGFVFLCIHMEKGCSFV